MPSQDYWGSVASDNQRYVYILPSENTNTRKMILLDTLTNTFTPASPEPDSLDRVPWDNPQNAYQWTTGNATTATYDGNKWVYAIGGAEANWTRFVKFDPKTGETRYLPPPYYAGTVVLWRT